MGEDGQMYASEHGDSANDEINEIEAGKNYGWPVIQGNQTQTGMRKPLFTSGSDQTWAPSGMAYHEDNLYVAALRGTAVLEVNSPGKKVTERLTEYGRIRDIYIMEEWCILLQIILTVEEPRMKMMIALCRFL